jgi:hypothetical protein
MRSIQRLSPAWEKSLESLTAIYTYHQRIVLGAGIQTFRNFFLEDN